MGWSQSGRVRVAGLQDGGSEDKPSVQLFVFGFLKTV